MNCKYCNKTFHNKSNMIKHQKTNKKCIQIQLQEDVENIEINLYQCQYCNKDLNSKYSLNRHIVICKEKKSRQQEENKVVEVLEKNIEELKNEIKNIKAVCNTTINTNNNTNNSNNTNNVNTINNNLIINNVDFMSFMTEERIKEIFETNFKVKDIYGAQNSLANFTIKNFLTGENRPIYLCSDKERNRFYFLDETNKRIDDNNAQILINLIVTYGFETIKKSYNLHCKVKPDTLNKAFKHIMNIQSDRKDYVNHLKGSLSTSIKERQIRDKFKESELQDKSNDFVVLEEKVDFDEISGFSLHELQRYKKYYIETEKYTIPASFEKTSENINKLKIFFRN